MPKHKIVSLFAGCGGLDLGFSQAGFDVAWANEYDKSIWETYEANHPHTKLDKRSIRDIPSCEIPEADGIIGGPPCQSWSLAGAMRGIKDERGQLFYEYIRVLRDKRPLFFLAENVAGIISSAHIEQFKEILSAFEGIGYKISYKLLDAKYHGVPQDRKRVIIVGYSNRLNKQFVFPEYTHIEKKRLNKDLLNKGLKPLVTLEQSFAGLGCARAAKDKNKSWRSELRVPNHEYMTGGFSTIYMSRNRRRKWNETSFTIQAGGRHAPLHPSSCEMLKLEPDKWVFVGGNNAEHRRLSVRECARVQTFPKDFVFKYSSVADGYKMVGNAVPVLLAKVIAEKIKVDLKSCNLCATGKSCRR